MIYMFGITIKTRINDDGKVEVTIDDETDEKRLQRAKTSQARWFNKLF